jgi:hypothetical protein
MSFAGLAKNGCSTITPPFSPKGPSNNGRMIIPTLSAHMQINNKVGAILQWLHTPWLHTPGLSPTCGG